MIRFLHRWPGLIAAMLLIVLALSGTALSVFPALESVQTPPQAEAGLRVATLAERIRTVYPGVEQIRRAPSGRITACWFDAGTPGAAVIDPATGAGVGSADSPPIEGWLKNLHRSLFLDDNGRIVAAAGAAAMLVLALSGLTLVARRTGGRRRVFTRLKGPLTGRLHAEVTRIAVAGLVLSSLTALWMTASTFGYLPQGAGPPPLPAVSGQTGMALTAMPALRDTLVTMLRDVTFPYPDDPSDAFTLTTAAGEGEVDQGTGALLGWTAAGGWDRVSETIYMLHTGRGAAVLGLIMGVMALGVPVMAVTGIWMWVAARRGRPRLRGNVAAGLADTILLVGSEGGSTRGVCRNPAGGPDGRRSACAYRTYDGLCPRPLQPREAHRGARCDRWGRGGTGDGQGVY